MLLCRTSVPFRQGCSAVSLHLACWELLQKCRDSDVSEHRGVTGQSFENTVKHRGKPVIKVFWEPPGPNSTSAEDALTKRASNQCETHLKLGFQSVRFTSYCASRKNYLSIIDLSSLKVFQLYVSFTQLFFVIPIFVANIAQAFAKEFSWRKSSYQPFCPICSCFPIV